MSKNRKHHARNTGTQTPAITPWQIAVLLGVILLIVVVLWLKNRPAILETAVAKSQPTLGVHVGPTIFATLQPATATPATIAVLTDDAAATGSNTLAPREGESPEAHLDRLVEEGQPVFAFFHSTTCSQCTEMTKIVEQVYPDFATRVALVDVNVYDDANQSLLQRAGIRVIPTLIFIDRTGQGEGTTGVMPSEQLQERLAALAAGGTP